MKVDVLDGRDEMGSSLKRDTGVRPTSNLLQGKTRENIRRDALENGGLHTSREAGPIRGFFRGGGYRE